MANTGPLLKLGVRLFMAKMAENAEKLSQQQYMSNSTSLRDKALLNIKNKDGSVIVLLGSRETGKTELAYRLCEFLGRPTFAVSPEQAPPPWITRVDLADIEERVPVMSTLFCDDLPVYMSSKDYSDTMVKILERIIPMCRHERKWHIIFASQSAAQADKYILDCDLALFKPLGILMDGIERPHIGKIYKDLVNPCFDGRDDMYIKTHAYMIARSWRGIISVNRASRQD